MSERASENESKNIIFYTSVRNVFPLHPQPCSQQPEVLSPSVNLLSKLRLGWSLGRQHFGVPADVCIYHFLQKPSWPQ